MCSNTKDIILFGDGGHCRSIINICESLNIKIHGIVSKDDKIKNNILGYPIIGCDKDICILRKSYDTAFVAVGQIKNPNTRINIFNMLINFNFFIPTLISPFSMISRHTKIGSVTIVMHNVTINSNVKIGKNCIINSGAVIEHDCIIGDNTHISTGSIVNGGVSIGSKVFIGSGSIISNSLSISDNCFVKSGSIIKNSQ